MSDSLIRSFLVSDLSNSLTIAHFLWATWANRSWSLIFGERNERFAHMAHLIWAKWAIHSHRSPKKRKWAKMSDSLIFPINFFLSYIKHTKNKTLDFFSQIVLSDLSDSLMVAHLSWVIWANHTQSLIWFERNERMSDVGPYSSRPISIVVYSGSI